jgi:hypothetical protein
MKKRIRATSALAAEIPVKPKIAATMEMRKNMRAHLSNVMNVPRYRRLVLFPTYSNAVIHSSFQNKQNAQTQRLALPRQARLNGGCALPEDLFARA